MLVCTTPAHPRSRGENSKRRPRPAHLGGSSPLTRGKPPRVLAYPHHHGLIPAHAGKTQWLSGSPQGKPAHPRSRGENLEGLAGLLSGLGSSPLTRGKRFLYQTYHRKERLIPAHAGKTAGGASGRAWRRAHPRSRGENRMPRTTRVIATGSSPLTRGKLGAALPVPLRNGLIPAHAGKTLVANGVHFRVPAHPRSRGENTS